MKHSKKLEHPHIWVAVNNVWHFFLIKDLNFSLSYHSYILFELLPVQYNFVVFVHSLSLRKGTKTSAIWPPDVP